MKSFRYHVIVTVIRVALKMYENPADNGATIFRREGATSYTKTGWHCQPAREVCVHSIELTYKTRNTPGPWTTSFCDNMSQNEVVAPVCL